MEPLTNEWRDVILKPQFIFRVGVLVLLGFMSVRFLHPLSLYWLGLNPGPMHPLNLIFHEAGHALLFWASPLLHALGGTIGQLAMPLALVLAFGIKHRNLLDASLCLWWVGQSAADCAPYIADARALRLPLITGYTGAEAEGHDWEFILGQLNLLTRDQAIAAAFLWTGRIVMVLSLLIGLACLACQILSAQSETRSQKPET
jgi:hypothetical protein